MPKKKMMIAPSNPVAHLEDLKKYWDSYGHEIKFEDLDGFKMRSDECYIVVRWKNEEGRVETADLTRGDPEHGWDMQNDGHESISEKDWDALYIPFECDWFVIPGNRNFPSMGTE
jgi:hypothetical protein